MRNWLAAVLGGAALAGCAAVPATTPGVAMPAPVSYGTAGLERVLGEDAAAVTRLLGKPDADLIEGTGRKLQFGSGICVLDAYLYPPANNPRGSAVVTHVDARQPDGRPIDRASCVAALTRREGGR